MELANLEVVATDSGPEAIFDLSELQALPLAAALSYYRRARYAYTELEAADYPRLQALSGLADKVARVVESGDCGVLRLSATSAQLLAAAVELFLLDRDTETYQSAEERGRIALLRELVPELTEMASRMHPLTAVAFAPYSIESEYRKTPADEPLFVVLYGSAIRTRSDSRPLRVA